MKRLSLLFFLSFAIISGCYAPRHTITPAEMPAIHRIGIPTTRNINLPPFSAVDTNGPYTVQIISREPWYGVRMIGDKAILERIRLYVENNTLYIRMQPGFRYFETGPVLVKVCLKDLRLLRYSGTGNVESTTLHGSALSIRGDGTGQIDLVGMTNLQKVILNGPTRLNLYWVSSPIVRVHLAGHATLFLAGKTDILDAVLSDVSTLEAKYLRAEKGYINTAQHARAEVWTNDSLTTLATGNSNIYYYHEPQFIAPYMRDQGSVVSLIDIGRY
jgi:hypothetical protein